MVRLSLSVLALFLISFHVDVALADSSMKAGEVTYVAGDAYVIREGERSSLADGDQLFSTDTVVTGRTGRVRL